MSLSRDSFLVLVLLLSGALAAPALAAAAEKPAKPTPVVVEPQPDAADLMTRSREAQSRGETELALRLAQAAIVAAPSRPSAYIALGDLYAAAGQSDSARSYYDAALGIDPFDADAQKAIAALDRGGDQRSANAEGTKTGTP